jgi:hypothetical protein
MQSLRGVSLPDDEVMNLLQHDFVVTWRNIQKDGFVGLSQGYRADQTAIGTTNGAGGRNVQLVILAPDETVLHVLPGFWHPEDLANELRFARALYLLWLDENKTPVQKQAMYLAMHRAHVRAFDKDTIARSDWQGFDRWEEQSRVTTGPRDTAVMGADGKPLTEKHGVMLKPLCVLVHDRMMSRPFQKYAQFDFESFVDYGRPYYDNNVGMDKGKSFPAAQHANEQRERDRAKAAAEEAKAAAEEAKAADKAAKAGKTVRPVTKAD